MVRRRRRWTWLRNPLVVAAIIAAVGGVVAAFVTGGFGYLKERPPDGPGPAPVPTAAAGTARLEGVVIDRSGNALGGLSVGVKGGPKTNADTVGRFVLNNLPAGDQLIVVKSADGRGGEVTSNIRLEEGKLNRANILYDPGTSRLGLLSITAPVDGVPLDVPLMNNRRIVTVYGRCDGLGYVLGNNFQVWVLVKPPGDQLYFVQHPEAIIDAGANSWQADIYLGDETNPPADGSRWTLVALGVRPEADLKRLSAIRSPDDVPERINSNLVTFTAVIKAPKRAAAAPPRLRVIGDSRRDVYETPAGSLAGKVEPGSVLKVLDTVQVRGGTWYQVKLESGQMYTNARPINTLMTGWVYYLAVAKVE